MSRGPGHKRPGEIHVVVTEARLNAMGDKMAHFVRMGLADGMRSIKRHLSADDMRRAFMTKNYEPVTEDMHDAIDEAMRPHIQGAMGDVAKATIKGTPGIAEKYRYDHLNPRMHGYVQSRVDEVITTSEQGLARAVHAMTKHALKRGVNFQQAAATVRNSIGLNAPQSQALTNYVAALTKSGLPEARIDALAGIHADRMLDYRAMMIARTEVRNAQNQAQLDVWQQARDDDLLPSDSKKVWMVDGNPCAEWCRGMDGEAVRLDEQWRVQNTKTGEVQHIDVPSETHPHCMCSQSIAFA